MFLVFYALHFYLLNYLSHFEFNIFVVRLGVKIFHISFAVICSINKSILMSVGIVRQGI